MRPLLRSVVLAALALAFAAAGCGGNGGGDAAAPDTSPIGGETVPAPGGGETAPGEVMCSASADTGLTLPEQELPAPVAETRQMLFDAAIACDYEELERIATATEGFTFTFGDARGGPAQYWRSQEEEGTGEPMYALSTLLTLPFAQIEESGAFAWPSAHGANPTDADWQALVDAFLYTPTEVQEMRESGTGYTGWRTAITPQGEWQFFTAGD